MSESALAPRPTAARGRRSHGAHAVAPAAKRTRRPRVAVVERHALVAEAIGLTLASTFEAIPVPLQSFTTTAAARDAVLRSRADVAVLIPSPGGVVDTLTLVEQLSAHDISVLVAGDELEGANAERYLCAGAAAFWHTGGVADVVRAVTLEAERRAQQLATGSTRPARAPLAHPSAGDRHDEDRRTRRDLTTLTPAEARILWALMRGRSADDIARDHVVSIATVRTQIKQVLGKLGATSQLSAVALAWRVDWTPGGDLGSP
jgi:two-component system nitrate/nitrite response regulator NarL